MDGNNFQGRGEEGVRKEGREREKIDRQTSKKHFLCPVGGWKEGRKEQGGRGREKEEEERR